jgi:hypothetical protein
VTENNWTILYGKDWENFMKTDSEFRRWMRRFQENNSETLVEYADFLHADAKYSIIRGALLWGTGGFLFSTFLCLLLIVIFSADFEAGRAGSLEEALVKFIIFLKAHPPSVMILLVGTWLGGWCGGRMGDRRAVHLNAIALVALSLARIEAKLSKPEESDESPRK